MWDCAHRSNKLRILLRKLLDFLGKERSKRDSLITNNFLHSLGNVSSLISKLKRLNKPSSYKFMNDLKQQWIESAKLSPLRSFSARFSSLFIWKLYELSVLVLSYEHQLVALWKRNGRAHELMLEFFSSGISCWWDFIPFSFFYFHWK